MATFNPFAALTSGVTTAQKQAQQTISAAQKAAATVTPYAQKGAELYVASQVLPAAVAVQTAGMVGSKIVNWHPGMPPAPPKPYSKTPTRPVVTQAGVMKPMIRQVATEKGVTYEPMPVPVMQAQAAGPSMPIGLIAAGVGGLGLIAFLMMRKKK